MTTLSKVADLLAGIEAQFVEDAGLEGFGRILAAAERLMEEPLAEVALGAFRHSGGVRRDRLDRFLAHDHLVRPRKTPRWA